MQAAGSGALADETTTKRDAITRCSGGERTEDPASLAALYVRVAGVRVPGAAGTAALLRGGV